MKEKINILFVCRYNLFRSRIAEAYFKKINKNRNIKVKSAGLFQGKSLSIVALKEAKKFGFNILGKPKGLSTLLMEWQDITIIVADDVPPQIFDKDKKDGKKAIVWKIKDANCRDKKGIDKAIKEIIKRVDKLNNGDFLRRNPTMAKKKRGNKRR